MTGMGTGLEILVSLFVGVAASLIVTIILARKTDWGGLARLGVAFLFFLMAVMITSYSIGSHPVEVPDIVGYSEDDAEYIIEKKGLFSNVTDRIHNDTVQKYKVISQDPRGGLRVKKGSIVNVVISEGMETPIIKITCPKNGDDFPLHTESKIKGTISYVPDNQHLWIVMLNPNNKYYPFSGEPPIHNGTWQTISYGGGEDADDGNTFSIGAYLLDERAYKEFKEYVEEAVAKDTWDGMDLLPEGVKKYDEVLVIGSSNKPWIKLNFSKVSNNTFKGHIEAENLKENTDYVLCIHGKTNKSGNEILMMLHKHKKGVGYWDIDQVRSDSSGKLDENFSAKDLPEGTYDAKFLIKELPIHECIAAYELLEFEIDQNNVTESYKEVHMKILN